MIKKLDGRVGEMGVKMERGMIVDLRRREVVRERVEEGGYGVVYCEDMREGKVVWGLGKEGEVIKRERKGFLEEKRE